MSKLDRNDRILGLSGFPMSSLKKTIPLTGIKFVTAASRSANPPIIIENNVQSEFFDNMLATPLCLSLGGSYAVGSVPSELAAQSLVVHLARAYQEACFQQGTFPKLQWIDVGVHGWDALKSMEKPDVVIISGASNRSDARKTELVRDVYNKMSDSTRIIVALTDNILTFCLDILGIEPEGVFQIGRNKIRVVT